MMDDSTYRSIEQTTPDDYTITVRLRAGGYTHSMIAYALQIKKAAVRQLLTRQSMEATS